MALVVFLKSQQPLYSSGYMSEALRIDDTRKIWRLHSNTYNKNKALNIHCRPEIYRTAKSHSAAPVAVPRKAHSLRQILLWP